MSGDSLPEDTPQLALDDVLDLIDWKEIEMTLGTSSAATIESKTAVGDTNKAGTPVKPPKKKRVRREVVELKYLREKVKELEEQLDQLTTRSAASDGDFTVQGGFATPVWASVAGRQLNDRTRAEKENERLRGMLEDQLKIAQGLEKILEQLPKRDHSSSLYASAMPRNRVSLSDALKRMDEAYWSAEQVLEVEGLGSLEPGTHEFKSILHSVYGMCIRFTAKFIVPYKQEMVKKVLWESVQQVVLSSMKSSITKTHSSEDLEERHFVLEVDDVQPAKSFWVSQVVRKYEDEERAVIVGRSTFQPFVKDDSHPAGVRFFDDARLAISECGDSAVPATSLKVCAYLVPDFTAGSSRSVGIGELTQFFINVAPPRIAKGHDIMAAMLFQEEWLHKLESENTP